MKPKRRNVHRDRARPATFFATKCIICYEANEVPSIRLPCCRKQIHEHCLNECFRYAVGASRYRCPHCRRNLVCYHAADGLPSYVPPGFCAIGFQHVSYERPAFQDLLCRFSQDEQSNFEEQPNHYEQGHPVPTPPPGFSWERIRQVRLHDIREMMSTWHNWALLDNPDSD